MKMNEYKPTKGFFDLRNFNIPNKTTFKKLAKIQTVLIYEAKKYSRYTKEQIEANKISFMEFQEYHAQFQIILLGYGENDHKAQYKLNLKP